MRKDIFSTGEFYHVFNRGVDKRNITVDISDTDRLQMSLYEFNTIEPIGSIYENSFNKNKKTERQKRPVDIVCYCINPNHFHLILKQREDGGISRFMQRVGTGYTKYFNNRHKRSGALFQGVFKGLHISTNEKLLQLSVYVNLNYKVHQLGSEASKLVRSSWGEYFIKTKVSNLVELCEKDIILEQFKSHLDYKNFASETLPTLLEEKEREKELAVLMIE